MRSDQRNRSVGAAVRTGTPPRRVDAGDLDGTERSGQTGSDPVAAAPPRTIMGQRNVAKERRTPMPVFERIEADDYEQVVFCHHRASGLRAIVAIHSTALGPALGGTRFYPYAA